MKIVEVKDIISKINRGCFMSHNITNMIVNDYNGDNVKEYVIACVDKTNIHKGSVVIAGEGVKKIFKFDEQVFLNTRIMDSIIIVFGCYSGNIKRILWKNGEFVVMDIPEP